MRGGPARTSSGQPLGPKDWCSTTTARPPRRPPAGGPVTGCSTPCRQSSWARCSATASRCMTRTGLRHCPMSSPGGEAIPLIPVLYRLAVDGQDTAQVRANYHHTLAELYQEHFVGVVQPWAASRGVSFRIQNYGTPPATISSYRFADMFEG